MQASIPTEADGGTASKSAPPTQEELAAAFPQLEILELIGQGGMGFVFKARQPKIDRFVALKILPASLAADPAFAERFTREGRVLARLNHPNIVTIHDFGQADDFFYLLMEFVDGVNLRQAMKVGRFTPAQALAIVPKICDALQFAHNEGILHRDIKPENILLDSKGRVKIADFGIAKLVGANVPAFGVLPSGGPDRLKPGLQTAPVTLTETGKVLGTPNYMAPEQLEHPQDVD
jgi:serine/threonine protein kinase